MLSNETLFHKVLPSIVIISFIITPTLFFFLHSIVESSFTLCPAKGQFLLLDFQFYITECTHFPAWFWGCAASTNTVICPMEENTPWDPVNQARGGSWRASSGWTGSELDCTAARLWSRWTGMAAALHSEGYNGAKTYRILAAEKIQNRQTPSAPAITLEQISQIKMSVVLMIKITLLTHWTCFLTLYFCRIEAASLWSEIDSQMFGKDVRL